MIMNRRSLLTTALTLGAMKAFPGLSYAQARPLVFATFTGSWEEAHKAVLVPAFRKANADAAMVLDPMLATGGSATAALMTLREWGVPQVKVLSLIAAQQGVDAVSTQFPEAQIYVCQIDPELNAHKFIVPGLGDAGDRIFNTLEPHD